MSDVPHNLSDPLFLFSRSLDECLTEEEQRRLDEALQASPSLRQESDALRTVTGLIDRWSRQPVELDWPRHAGLIYEQAAARDEEELGEIDTLLQRWATTTPAYDADAFTAKVMDGIARSEPRLMRRSLIFRLAAPLSAAAAIALVITGLQWFRPDVQPAANVSYTMPFHVASEHQSTANVTVSFRRTPPLTDAVALAAPAFSFISVGATDLPAPATEIPPL